MMNTAEAMKMVEDALEQRRKFGKHFGVRDMPPEFLDALVMEFDRLKALVLAAEGATKDEYEALQLEQHGEIVLLKRQLGAAKSRETQLRKQLAKAVEAGLPAGNSAE